MSIFGLVTLAIIVLSHELVFHDGTKESVRKCLDDAKFVRKTKRDKYVEYVFKIPYGRMYELNNLTAMLEGFIGKPVRVFFDRVLTVWIYHENLPRKVIFQETKQKSKLVEIGVGVDGHVFHDFEKYPHMIIAGTTGYGKTNLIKSIIHQLNSKVTLIDLKNDPNDYPVSSATDILEAAEVLQDVTEGFVIVDEAAELLAPQFMTKKERYPYEFCQMVLSEIARMGRSRGINLIYCTQYPTGDVLPRQIKQNAESRVCFRTVTEVASRVALDESGAESLEAGLYGRAIYKTDVVHKIQTFKYEGSGEHACIRTKKKERVRHSVEIG